MGKTNNGTKNQVFRTNKGCSGDTSPRCHSGAKPVGGINGDETVRTDRPYWFGRNNNQLLGGILTQLIEEYEDQLGETQEDIARLQRRAAKLEKRLANLERLKAIQQGESN